MAMVVAPKKNALTQKIIRHITPPALGRYNRHPYSGAGSNCFDPKIFCYADHRRGTEGAPYQETVKEFMATYIIGDVQGCFLSLKNLLSTLQFEAHHDRLIFLGDTINRGPRSLETLRFIKANQSCMRLVLGNHEIFAMSLYIGAIKASRPHTLDDLLLAPDVHELMSFLRAQPLIIREENRIFIHAGILPAVSINDAILQASHVSSLLQSDDAKKFLKRFYEKTETLFRPDLGPKKSLRLTLAYLTLLRMCDEPYSMDLSYTGTLEKAPKRLKPWFILRNDPEQIYFGHWAALGLHTHGHYHCLDTGCAWGGKLSALRLEDDCIFQVDNSD